MSNYILQIEAVNIYDTLKTTEQLSVRRGVTLAYRNIMFEVEKQLADYLEKEQVTIETISVGGSVGIFRLNQCGKKFIQTLKEKIAYFLVVYPFADNKKGGGDEPTIPSLAPYLGLLVSYAELENDDKDGFKNALDSITRDIRLQQLMNYPSYPIEQLYQLKAKNICTDDGVLPADTIVDKNKKTYKVSTISKAFFEYGKNAKHDFVISEIEKYSGINEEDEESAKKLTEKRKTTDITFTNDFEQLSTLPKSEGELSGLIDNTKAKMAVLYFDGNGFSKIKNQLTSEAFNTFDKEIRKYRARFLKKLIVDIVDDKLPLMYDYDDKNQASPKNQDGDKGTKEVKRVKLETLEWGGDELLLVVPAWAAFQVLNLFYETQQGLKSNGKTLTHAGGMVICSHKTRIDRVKNIAIEAAEVAKRFSRQRNLYNIVVLESEEYLTESLPDYWQKHYGNLGKAWLPFEYQEAEEITDKGSLKPELNISRLRRLLIDMDQQCKNRNKTQEIRIYNNFISILNDSDNSQQDKEVNSDKKIEAVSPAAKRFKALSKKYLNILNIEYSQLPQKCEENNQGEFKKYECYLKLNHTLQPLILFIEYLDYLHHIGIEDKPKKDTNADKK